MIMYANFSTGNYSLVWEKEAIGLLPKISRYLTLPYVVFEVLCTISACLFCELYCCVLGMSCTAEETLARSAGGVSSEIEI